MRKLTQTQFKRALAHATKKELYADLVTTHRKLDMMCEMCETLKKQIAVLDASNAAYAALVETYRELDSQVTGILASDFDEVELPAVVIH